MDKTYGEIFKSLRLNKGFSIKEIACEQVSRTTISKFENGCSNISIDKFFNLLKNINVSPQEFFIYLEESWGTTYSVSMINLPLAFDHRNYIVIESLLANFVKQSKQLPNNNGLKLQVISIKALIHMINHNYEIKDEEITTIKQYLSLSKMWTEFEIQLFSRSVSLFDLETIRALIKRLLDPFNYVATTFEIKLYTYNALINITNTLVERKAFDALMKIERFLYINQLPERYMFQKAILRFNFAICHFFTGTNENKKRSLFELRDLMRVFEITECFSWTARLKDTLSTLGIDLEE